MNYRSFFHYQTPPAPPQTMAYLILTFDAESSAVQRTNALLLAAKEAKPELLFARKYPF